MSNLPDLNPLDLLDQIPGVKEIRQAADALGHIAGAVGGLWDQVHLGHGEAALIRVVKDAGKAGHAIESLTKLGWRDFAQFGTGTLFREYLEVGLGLDYDRLNSEAKQAVTTIDTMLTFSTVFPLVIKGADAILHFFLGQRAPHLSEGVLGHISEEMGLTWAMGMTIDRAFEAAVGNKLEEAILHQKRPIDPELQVIRLMMRQHILTRDVFEDRAAHMGYSKEWVERFGQLADALLPVGDLQQLYLYDLIAPDAIDSHLEALGFNADIRPLLQTLYIDKVQTGAGASLRSIARDLAVKEIFTPAQYKAVLQSTHMPDREIAEDMAGLQLQMEWGRTNTPVSVIKARYEHGELVDDTATPELRQLGYTNEAIADMLAAWKLPKLPHPMTANKVLSYFYSGVLTDKSDVLNRLILTGLRPEDAIFLRDHPPAAHVRKHALTPSLIVQAFLDGVIDQGVMEQRLEDVGLSPDAAQYQTAIAVFRKSRLKRPAGAGIALTAGQVLDALKVGVFDPLTTQAELEKLGYSPDDALVLMEVKLKGQNPFAKSGPAAFRSLEDAEAYMVAHGYQIISPPDPMLTAAESLLASHGYSWRLVGAGIATIPGGLPGFPVTREPGTGGPGEGGTPPGGEVPQ